MGHNKNKNYSYAKKVARLDSGEKYECVDFEATLVSLREILPPQVFYELKNGFKPLMDEGQCHKNAWRFAQTFSDVGMEYCEGILLPDGMQPIHHCFNRINGKFVDVTQEIVLDEDFSTKKWRKVRVKRIFPYATIQKIFEKEMNTFITFDGYEKDGHTIRYDDEGNRVSE